jgi:hypothetical protein
MVDNLVPLCRTCNYLMPQFDGTQMQAAVDWVLDGGCLQYCDITEEGYLVLNKAQIACDREERYPGYVPLPLSPGSYPFDR